jgi:heptaprenyl diphosphate synthase
VATSARFGASFAGLDPALEALTRFGEEVGRGLPALRRPARHRQRGRRLREVAGHRPARGHRDPAALFALAGDDPAEQRLRELVSGPITDDAEHAEALELLRSSAALQRATEVLREYADRAQTRLGGVPEGPVREALSALCDYVVTRTS